MTAELLRRLRQPGVGAVFFGASMPQKAKP
jgi:hypothetical protein